MADPSDDIEVPGLGAEDEPMDDDLPDVDVKKEKDLTGDGGLTKRIITEGSGWETPSKGDSVTVHYHGTLEDGSVFDSSRDRGDPFVFTIGQGQVIKGWDKGVITMKRGEKALLTCKSDYAYGEAGSPPKIPPNATLQFEVELLSWKSIKDIAGDGGIIKTIETEGQGWEKPKDRDEALVKYVVRAAGSSTAAMASPEEGAVVQVGSGQPLKAFPIALKSMKQGEKAFLKIKPEYGFASPQEGVPEGAELEADLELVTIRKVEDVTDDGKVVTKLVRKGKDYKRPNEGATVKVAYTGRIGGPDGPVFEEHSKESPLGFVTDEDAVVEGLDMAVMKHNEDEAFEVTVAPEYGFGDREEKRALATVPPDSQLHYAVEILDVQKAKESWDLSNEDKVELAKKRKEQGNALFKAGKWERAIAKYKSAVDTVGYDKDFSEELKKECAAIKKSADLNKAAASLKLHNYRDAIAAASKVLEAEPGNVKALYRRAQGHLAEQDLVEAELDIRAALLVEPNNKDVRALKLRYKKEAAAANAKDKAMYQRAFQKLAQMPDTEPRAPQAEPKMTEADSKPEPESHPIDIMDSAASEALLIDEEQPAAADTPAAAETPALNGHLHAEEKDTLEAPPAAQQPMAVET